MMRPGSVFQIMDPWATSWYSDVWQNSVPRGIALGQTVGEIYTEGISKVGILYITEPPGWWWDQAENVCLYGDPDLRIWVPSTEYDPTGANHWTAEEVESLSYNDEIGLNLGGHNPFGTDDYPNQITPVTLLEQILWILAIVVFASVVIIAIVILMRRKR